MYQLPDPQHTRPAGQPTDADRETIRRLFAALDELGAERPTAVRIEDPAIPTYQDGPRVGTTPPVPQPDSRIVPAWALGIAVASIGVGAGVTGLGCGAWLVFKGLSMVSVPSLQTFVWVIVAPFAGAAMLFTAAGGAFSKFKKAATPEVHHHNGPEYHETTVDQRRAVWQKNITKH